MRLTGARGATRTAAPRSIGITVEPLRRAAERHHALPRAVRAARGRRRCAGERRGARSTCPAASRDYVTALETRAALHQGEPAGDDRGARDRERGAAGDQRGAGRLQRGAAEHQRGAALGQRGALHGQRRVPAQDHGAHRAHRRHRQPPALDRRRHPVPRRRALHPQVHLADRRSVFRLLPQDVGRRIDSFAPTIQHPGLDDDVDQVLKAAAADRARGPRPRRACIYLLRILPYRSTSAEARRGASRSSTSARSSAAEAQRAPALGDRRAVERRDHRRRSDGKIAELEPRRRAASTATAADEAIGRNIAFLIPDDRRVELDELCARVSAAEQVERLRDDAACARTARGVDVHSVTASPILDEHNDVVGTSIDRPRHLAAQARRGRDPARAAGCASSSWRCSRTSCAIRWRRC